VTTDDWAVPPDDLTAEQRSVVEHFEGPLLVLAGPGSGKTRVITRRIARLIERGIRESEILAITFTNKAAREMSERVAGLLPGSRIWVSTFHRFCARLLRERGRAVGLEPNFSIYDTGDQLQLIKLVLHDLDLDPTHFPPAKLAHRISQAKNDLLDPERYLARYGQGIGTHLEAVVAQVYPRYQQRLLEANAVDFDDLLTHVARILNDNDDLRETLDHRFRFILVDEYQDTNRAQYQIVAALSQIEPNLCATGDPDQSIYGWRGAQIENILRFERDFPDVRLIRLEANFRSTPEILRTADALIAHNVHRKAKRLTPVKPSGDPVELRCFADGQDEADGIAREILSLVNTGHRSWKDFAILYRVNSLSRTLETTLARYRIPHQVAGGVAFFERMEVKDLIGYLRLIENPRDRTAFLRVVNTPARGIGKSSLQKLVQWADLHGKTLLDAARDSARVPDLPRKSAAQLRAFAGMIDEFADFVAVSPTEDLDTSFDPSQFDSLPEPDTPPAGPVARLLEFVMQRTGYAAQFDDASQNEDSLQRLSNIHELVTAAALYDSQEGSSEQGPTLGGFLETASLAQDVDSIESDSGAVTLMTLHSAKGLEFPNVYIVAVEQNIIPHERSLRENDPKQLEEERRLLFVGITRAQQKLVLTSTLRRELHGRSVSSIPSDFLSELDVRHRDMVDPEAPDFGDDSMDFAPDLTEDEAVTVRPRPERSRRQLPPGLVHDKLTTGASLQTGIRSTAHVESRLSIGMRVRHPRYGMGTVVDVSGMARRRTVMVQFDSDDRKESFIEDKCPLQPAGFGTE